VNATMTSKMPSYTIFDSVSKVNILVNNIGQDEREIPSLYSISMKNGAKTILEFKWPGGPGQVRLVEIQLFWCLNNKSKLRKKTTEITEQFLQRVLGNTILVTINSNLRKNNLDLRIVKDVDKLTFRPFQFSKSLENSNNQKFLLFL